RLVISVGTEKRIVANCYSFSTWSSFPKQTEFPTKHCQTKGYGYVHTYRKKHPGLFTLLSNSVHTHHRQYCIIPYCICHPFTRYRIIDSVYIRFSLGYIG